MRTLTLALLAFVAFASSARAQDWPLEIARRLDGGAHLELSTRSAELAALTTLERVRFERVPLPGGSTVELDLERLHHERLGFGFQVDGTPFPGLLSGLDLSVWRGRVVGEPESEVALAFSQAGSQGWIQRGDALLHLVSASSEDIHLVDASRLAQAGFEARFLCALDGLQPEGEQVPRPRTPEPPLTKAGGAAPLYECSIAIETDWQLNQVFAGDLLAETVYVVALLTWASYRFEEQIGTVFSAPYVQFYTTPADPWTVPDVGGNCIDMIYEFQAAWQGSVPAGAELGHFLSGAPLGCGVAFIAGICDPTENFSVTGNIDGNNVFPIQVGPTNFNFYGVTHEIGHNFDAIHTHDYCPPIDECAPPGYFGPCQTQKVCITGGTNMSYCGGCPGGYANITTFFHPQSVSDMRSFVEGSCLPLACPDPIEYCSAKISSLGCVPNIGWEGHPTSSGLDDFVVSADQIHNNQNGLLFYGAAAASQSFNGGTLCVAPPIQRLAVQASGGSGPPTNDCSGSFAQSWTHGDFGTPGLLPGTTVFCQYWFRDSNSSGGSGLSNALEFTVCN